MGQDVLQSGLWFEAGSDAQWSQHSSNCLGGANRSYLLPQDLVLLLLAWCEVASIEGPCRAELQGRLRRTVVMKKMSQQPEAFFFLLVVGMLGLWAPSSLQVVQINTTSLNGITVDYM